MRLRDYTPRGYNARNILILVVPMLLFMLAMTLYFFNSHVQEVNRKLSQAVALELAALVDASRGGPADWDRLAGAYARAGVMTASLDPNTRELTTPAGRRCCEQLAPELDARLAEPFAYAYQPGDLVSVRILSSAGLIEARFERKRVVIITAHIFIVWSVIFSLFLLATSYAFLRNQVKSILHLASAADAFGRGEDAPQFKPSGALEVRAAARALIRMRNRIRRYADQRTAMLAGVSHDLRTPLSRLKLELALLPKDIDMSEAKADIDEMERMLDGYLAFARGEESEQPADVDLSILARDASSHIGDKAEVELRLNGPIELRARPTTLKRAITNLVNNAADYGRNVAITVSREPAFAVLTVEDDGPGIPEAQYEEAFRPFSRLDASRNQNRSGVGLGMTIARDAARAHGGDVVLGRSELGGLKATLRVPFDAARRLAED
jgi:two-component system, OmpR family, osmolarity sensor histidine kinase EnvZ